jgi:type IV pilus assembly protein PilC
MSVMLRSGLTLLESLRSAASQTPSRRLAAMLGDLAERIQSGQSLSDAMKTHRLFGRMTIQLMEVGEQTGELDEAMSRAAQALESKRLLKAQVISAMLYPAVVLLAAIGVTVFILVYAVPRLTVYLNSMGRSLPPMTQALVDLSDFLTVQWPLILGFLLLGVILYMVAYLSRPGRLLIDSAFLRIPLLGYINRTSATASFSRSLSILLRSGVTIVESLRVCQDLLGNRRLQILVSEGRGRIMNGEPLAPVFSQRGSFEPMLSSMIGVGERSGELDDVLASCADFHEHRLAALIRILSSVAEIVVVIVVGGIVGYVYIAFMMALYGAAL